MYYLSLLKYDLEPTNFTEFTILTWWYGLKEHQDSTKRAVISILKDNLFGSGIHLHAGCKDFPEEICLTLASQQRNELYSMKRLTTKDRPLALPQFPKWTYFGFSYKKSTKGELLSVRKKLACIYCNWNLINFFELLQI